MDDIVPASLEEETLQDAADGEGEVLPGDDTAVADDGGTGDWIDDGTGMDDGVIAGSEDGGDSGVIWDEFGDYEIAWEEIVWTEDDGDGSPAEVPGSSDVIWVDAGIGIVGDGTVVDDMIVDDGSLLDDGSGGETGFDWNGWSDDGFVWDWFGGDETYDDGTVWEDTGSGDFITIDFGVILGGGIVFEGDPPADIIDFPPGETDGLSGPGIVLEPFPCVAICIMYPFEAII